MDDLGNYSLPTYVLLNDKYYSNNTIFKEFSTRDEFDLHILQSREKLSDKLLHCVQNAIDNDDDFFIICREGHRFTDFYRKDCLIDYVISGYQKRCDILLGGIGRFNNAVRIKPDIYWIDNFSICFFYIIYRKMYNKILRHIDIFENSLDVFFSQLTTSKAVIYPFISSTEIVGGISEGKSVNQNIVTCISDARKRLELYNRIYNRYY